MQLEKLLKNVNFCEIHGNREISINGLKFDSKKVEIGDVFFCLEGNKSDGHSYAAEAVANGAVCIVSDRLLEVSVTDVVVKDCREAMSVMAANFYSNPAEKLKMVAVVGTNGKTTTAHILRHILEHSGIRTGVIGTLGAKYKNINKETLLTTPDPIDLQRILSDMLYGGIRIVVMEVSAHAIRLKKVSGINYDVAIFTNLSQDHLDYFNTMEEYKSVKKSFFGNNVKYAVINSDDACGQEIMSDFENAISYGQVNPSDVFVIDIKTTVNGSNFVMNLFDKVYNVNTKFLGIFNIYNIMAAATAAAVLGARTNDIADAVESAEPVEGRLESAGSYNGAKIFVDYAHTPDGLLNVLSSMRPLTEGKLKLVFRSRGNRDSGKRKIMGEIACKNADFSVITSDNPRYEDPDLIIKQIESGFDSDNYIVIENRKDAIRYAVERLKKGDVLIIAGKGAEKYQEVLGIKHPFDDKKTVGDIVNS